MHRILPLLVFILISCNADDPIDPCADNLTATFEPCSSITAVTSDQCIIQKVQIRDAAGVLRDEFVYFHDGMNYNKIDRYYLEDNSKPWPVTPKETIEFSFNDAGQVSEITTTSFLIEGNPSTVVSTYTYGDDKLNIRFDVIEDDGSIGLSYSNNEYYPLNPPDFQYYFEQPVVANNDPSRLFEFNAGDLVRIGIPSTEGMCSLNGKKWVFVKNQYDDLPNGLTNYAVRYPLNVGKIVFGTMAESYVEISEHNIIGRVDKEGQEQYCWSFLKNNENYWVKEFSGERRSSGGPVPYNVTYSYDCE